MAYPTWSATCDAARLARHAAARAITDSKMITKVMRSFRFTPTSWRRTLQPVTRSPRGSRQERASVAGLSGHDERVTDRVPCPCCGYRTLPDRDDYELCPVCFWEDDPTESRAPGFSGGANSVDILTAQQTYLRIGAMHTAFVDKVRPPRPDEARAAEWRPFDIAP